METRYYEAKGLDIERLAVDLEQALLSQGDHVQHFGDQEQVAVQVKKGSDLAAFIGMQSALTVTMQRTPEGVMAMIGQQKWMDKAAVGVVGMLALWPLALTAGAGAFQQAQLGSQIMGTLDMLVRQQAPDVRISVMPQGMTPGGAPHPIPAVPPVYLQSMAEHQQRGSAGPFKTGKVTCAACHAENDEGAAYCMGCGKSLAPPQAVQKSPCPKCGAETKPTASFCTQCGTRLGREESVAEAAGKEPPVPALPV